MRPFYNPRPHHPNQQPPTASSTPQVMQSDHRYTNSSNIRPTPSQMGLIIPQTSTPFNNSNTHMTNFSPNPNIMQNNPSMMQSPCFMNIPNQMGLPFRPQNIGQNLNSPGMFPINSPFPNQINQSLQQNPQLYMQQFNQNPGFPNEQLLLQSLLQNANQFVPMQMPNSAQGVPFNGCPGSNNMVRFPTQMGPRNPAFIANQQVGQPNLDMNALQSNFVSQQLQGNIKAPINSLPTQSHQTPKNLQPSMPANSQENHGNGGLQTLNSNWKNSPGKNFAGNQKGNWGSRKSQLHQNQNGKGKPWNVSDNGTKGNANNGARKSGLANNDQVGAEKKRVPVTYSEQDIQQWREERRKNHPSRSNTEKKQEVQKTNSEAIDGDTKSRRRQQLKEILAKQAELGTEVADIPAHYLLDSEKPQACDQENNKGAWTRKERFQNNKREKRGRFRRKGRFGKRQKLDEEVKMNESENKPGSKKEESLLQKLLRGDIRKDKARLLQVFRFMAENSFFKDWPNKPLVFPVIAVDNDAGFLNEDQKSLLALSTVAEESDDDDDDSDDDDNLEKGL